MGTIQKIKAEIESRKKANQKVESEGGAGAYWEDVAILSFISLLEKEQNVDDTHPSAVKHRFLHSGKEGKIIKEMYKDRFDDITQNRVKYLTFFKQVELDGRFSELNDLLKRYRK